MLFDFFCSTFCIIVTKRKETSFGHLNGIVHTGMIFLIIKNYIMYSGRPSNYHGEKSAKLGEIWQLPEVKGKTRLVLVDALYPLCDKGPQSDPRYKWAYNGLIAGTDPVAVETVCLKILNAKRHALRGESWPISPPPICVDAADKIYGLGTSKIEEINIAHFGWKEGLLLG